MVVDSGGWFLGTHFVISTGGKFVEFLGVFAPLFVISDVAHPWSWVFFRGSFFTPSAWSRWGMLERIILRFVPGFPAVNNRPARSHILQTLTNSFWIICRQASLVLSILLWLTSSDGKVLESCALICTALQMILSELMMLKMPLSLMPCVVLA